MELEVRDQIEDDTNYNEYFYATMCHVCKRFDIDGNLKRCACCKMIYYCGEEHQRLHWPQHKHLCKVIWDTQRKFNTEGVLLEEPDEMKLKLMELVESKMERDLLPYEKQMFEFPKECIVCYEQNGELLENCRECAVSFCKHHKDDKRHTDICSALGLCLSFDLLSPMKKFVNICELAYMKYRYYVKDYIGNINTFENINNFIRIYENISTKDMRDRLQARKTLYLTSVLTLFHSLRLLNCVSERKDLVVHIIAADFSEERTFIWWEILLHLLEILTSLTIIMIGPKLDEKSRRIKLCDICTTGKKHISLEAYDILYENYVHSSAFKRPDLVIGYNARIHAMVLRSLEETWTSYIQVLSKQNCPFVFTSYTQQVLELNTNRINAILNKKVDCLYSGKNPFASLRPYRMIGREKVYYWNNYIAVYRSLSLTA